MKRKKQTEAKAGRPSRPRNMHATAGILRKGGHHRSAQSRRMLRDSAQLDLELEQFELGDINPSSTGSLAYVCSKPAADIGLVPL